MKLHVLIFRNTKIGCFTQPQFSDVEPEKAAIQLGRSLKLCEDVATLKKYEPLEMYHIGTFDDETGVFDAIQPVLLLNCVTCIGRKEEPKNGESVCAPKE